MTNKESIKYKKQKALLFSATGLFYKYKLLLKHEHGAPHDTTNEPMGQTPHTLYLGLNLLRGNERTGPGG